MPADFVIPGNMLTTMQDPVQLCDTVVHVVSLPPGIRSSWKGPPRYSVSWLYKQDRAAPKLFMADNHFRACGVTGHTW